jgi:hypothetical protein
VSSSDAKGLYALGILSQEASIIAAKERAEMKMIEFFISRKLLLLVFTAALNHTAPCAVKRAGIVLIARTTRSRRNGLAIEIRVSYAALDAHAATIFSRHVAVSGLRWTADGFPKACDHKYLSDHRLDRFDHCLDRFDYRLSKRCSALGCINALADWSTFNSAAGTVPNSHPHSRACIKSNTHSYADSEPDTITKPSTCRNASPTFTPPQIASHPVRAIRVYDDTGDVIERHEHAGDFKEP